VSGWWTKCVRVS